MRHGIKSDRNKNMIKRVLNGETLQKVGCDNGISATTVRSIFYQAMYRMFGNKHCGRESWMKIRKVNLKSWRNSKNYILNRL